MIFNIQRFCVNDGPGVRTSVFFKGCPLRCLWCHNPESQSPKKEIMLDTSKCEMCMSCAKLCPNGCHIFENGKHTVNREKCVACGKCEQSYCGCIEIAGREMTEEEIMSAILRDKEFYEKSGGGVTFSGGEPFMNYETLIILLEETKKNGIHVCVETCGYTSTEKMLKAAEYTDIFLFDYKETNPDLHKKFTGVSNELILKNLFALDKSGAKTILRCPIIPTCNNRDEHFEGIASVANKLKNIIEINVEPYHPLGISKSERLGQNANISSVPFPTKEDVEKWISKISEKTDVPVKRP